MRRFDRRGAARRAGFALISVVLLLIGLAVLATGLIYSAAQQSALAGSTHDVARARRAAEAAVGVALEQWNAGARSLDPIGSSRTLVGESELERGVTMHARSLRLAGDLHLVTGTGRAALLGTAPIAQSAARLVRSLDVDSVGRALDAALIAGSIHVGPGSIVQGSAPDSAPASESSDGVAATLCAGWPRGASALRAHPDSVAVSGSATVAGTPPLTPDADVARFLAGLGFLDRPSLAASGRPVGADSVTPGPVLAGIACDTIAPGSWGASAGACSAHRPLLHHTGPLTLQGGYGQGILIVEGDLLLVGDVRWSGLLLVTGTLTIRDATVEGAVLAGRVRVEGGAAILDRCRVASALVGSPATRRARLPARSWIPTFD